jgi:hypothetical protein
MRAIRATVKIRRDHGISVKPEAEQIDGKTGLFEKLWVFESDDDRYPGETAYRPLDEQWPADAPIWIASGDLEIHP